MRYFLDGEEVTLEELAKAVDDLDPGNERHCESEIIELDEIKSRIAWICKINADEGIKYENATYHSSGYEVKYDAVLSKAFLREEEELLKKRADELQDEIDEYNAITYVEIEFD